MTGPRNIGADLSHAGLPRYRVPVRIGGIALVAALLVAGAVGGYAGSQALREVPTRAGAPTPMSASDPEHPAMPAGDPLPDADVPELRALTPMSPQTLDIGDYRFSIRIPDGWDRTDLSAPTEDERGEWRWSPPDAPPGAYSVRIKRLESKLVPYIKVLRLEDLLANDPNISELEIVSDTKTTPVGTIAFTYRSQEGYVKLAIVKFASLPDSRTADVEIAWTGRASDEVGMRQLTADMNASLKDLGD